MIRGGILLVGGWLFVSANYCFSEEVSPQNVILITLDGVRSQEFFEGVDKKLEENASGSIFQEFWANLAPKSLIAGKSGEMEVANSYLVSLPAYQSIMAGSLQPCKSNACGRIGVSTLQERLVSEFRNSKDVATFASWESIALAVEKIPGATFVKAGRQDEQEATPPWKHARYDKNTIADAMNYLLTERPRFLYVSLNDADEWGHRNNYPMYVETLRFYDHWLVELSQTLESLENYGKNTTVFVTTDHGRGEGVKWKDHGRSTPSAKKIWFFAFGSAVPQGLVLPPGKKYSHLDIRPAIEKLLIHTQ